MLQQRRARRRCALLLVLLAVIAAFLLYEKGLPLYQSAVEILIQGCMQALRFRKHARFQQGFEGHQQEDELQYIDGGGGGERHLVVAVQASSFHLDPELLRQLWSIAITFRNEESKFLRWSKDVGLLRPSQYQSYLTWLKQGTLKEVDPQEEPQQPQDHSSTFIQLDLLRQAYRASLAAQASEGRFVQWMRGAGLLTSQAFNALEARLRKDLEDAKFKAEWETFKHKWEQRRAKIAIARRQQPEEKGGLAIEDSHP